MTALELEHSKHLHGYAVVRVDLPVDRASPEESYTVVKVFLSRLEADREVDRLNRLNGAKGCRYSTSTTRIVLEPAG